MRILSWVMLGALAACQAAAPVQMTDADRAQIVQAVEQQAATWISIANGLDATPLAALVADDIEVVDFMTDYAGVDAYLAGTQNLFDGFQAWTGAWDQTSVEVLGPDAALFTGRFTLRRQRVDGTWQESSPYIFITAIFQPIDGEWKITRAHLSGSLRAVEEAD